MNVTVRLIKTPTPSHPFNSNFSDRLFSLHRWALSKYSRLGIQYWLLLPFRRWTEVFSTVVKNLVLLLSKLSAHIFNIGQMTNAGDIHTGFKSETNSPSITSTLPLLPWPQLCVAWSHREWRPGKEPQFPALLRLIGSIWVFQAACFLWWFPLNDLLPWVE